MSWFGKEPKPEPDEPPIVRLASPEFVSGLVEIAEIYERREKDARASIIELADRLSRKQHFNYQELEEQYIGKLRDLILHAMKWQYLAGEMREWIQDYEHRGRRPPYMPEPPPVPKEPYVGGE